MGAEPHFEKLCCFEPLQRYERLIFLDTDVVLAPDCPNLLGLVPPDRFGAYVVSQHTDLHDDAILLIQRSLGDLGWRHDYFNSGVMVLSRAHAPVLDPEDPDLAVWVRTCDAYGGLDLPSTRPT